MPEWWKEYPDRDCEYVTYYPVAIDLLSASELWGELREKPREQLGFYIHVPLCPQICPFCNYNKFRLESPTIVPRYIAALVREVELNASVQGVGGTKVPFVYFGGGTPSVLGADGISQVLTKIGALFDLDGSEVTVEVHPTTASPDLFDGLARAGVNRVSLGLQSLQDRLLRQIGSYHAAADGTRALEWARASGITNVAIDLMFLLPGQTPNDWERDLREALALEPTHISLYRMLLDPAGSLGRSIRAGRASPQGDLALELEMAEQGFEILGSAQYSHYGSCSSSGFDFALPGGESQYEVLHRAAPQIEFLGLGAGAAAYANGHVYWTIHTLEEYFREVDAGRLPILAGKRLTTSDERSRFMVLGVKHIRVSSSAFRDRFGIEVSEAFGNELSRLVAWGLLEVHDDHVEVTRKGVMYMDNVSKAFYNAENYRVPQPYKPTLQLWSRQMFAEE